MKRALIATAAAAPLCMAMSAQAATITGWNTANVVVGPVVADGQTGFSVIYDRDPAAPGAVTNGRVAYTAPEANSPGMEVLNDNAATSSGPNPIALQGCIMASSTATCESGFQSGKRFKNQITGTGPIDFVFDVAPNTTPEGLEPYQVYHRLVNLTGLDLAGFKISLGAGIGGDFVASTAGDGLGFATNFVATGGVGGATQASSQFPFGLFGDASTNQNFTLDGFFAAERAGFTMSFSEDVLASTGLAGPYAAIFGPWMSQEVVPEGAFWDFDDNAASDDLLLAWERPDGKWEQRREVVNGAAQTLLSPLEFDSYLDLLASLDPTVAALLGTGAIEDLANLNVNYAISVAGFTGSQFTLRVDVAPVPLPMAAPLLMAGLGGLALVGRRRKAQAAA